MHIEDVEFTDFRNFPALSITPSSSLNILTGPNGQGKTNLLEGLGVLLVGRSFRGARAGELQRWESTRPSMMAGSLRRGEGTTIVRRTIQSREDGVRAISGEGCSWARVIPFTWQDTAILHGPPQARRDFLDGFAGKLYPAHVAVWNRYRQIVARRNSLLQAGAGHQDLMSRLEPWNAQLIKIGGELLARRLEAVNAIQREVASLYPRLAGGGQVALGYRSSLGDKPTAADFQAALELRYREEVRRGTTLVGPHRDDLVIELDGKDLRAFGSRGQQRLMALALRLAEQGPVAAAVGTSPVLLLDDALSELDPKVRAHVLEHVTTAGQVFLSTADFDRADGAAATWWDVRGGSVRGRALTAVRGAA